MMEKYERCPGLNLLISCAMPFKLLMKRKAEVDVEDTLRG
jgi:hypothetical protein